MRAQHLAASAVAALALAARPGAPRAEDAGLAVASRPFSLGEVSVERTVGIALRFGRLDCNDCFDASNHVAVTAWDIGAVLPIADRAAVFVLQPILFRSGGEGTALESTHKFPGAFTAGIRHVGAADPARSLAAAVSVSLPYPGGGDYRAEATTDHAAATIDDRSLYASGLSTLRIELDARWRPSKLFAQAQVALATHAVNGYLLGSSRTGLGAGMQLDRAALLAELTAQLGMKELACKHCALPGPEEGPGRLALSVGGRVALGSFILGARGFVPLATEDTWKPTPSVSMTVDARF